jgi:DNA repair exonuclease SbcCD ATPase subunit
VVQAAREQRDAEMDQLSSRYGTMLERLEEKLRRKEQELRAEQKELTDRRKEELYTTGEAILSLFRGRTNYTLSRMSRATRYRRQTKEDLRESHEFMDEVERQIGDLEIEYEQALTAVNDKWARVTTIVEDHVISPYKKDIQLELFGVGWLPAWHVNVNGQTMLVEAY